MVEKSKNSEVNRVPESEEKEKLIHDLRERNKELNLLYEVSRLSLQPLASLTHIIQEIVDLIPPAWHYPDATCARITVAQTEVTSDNFTVTPWRQSANIEASEKTIGKIEVFYLTEKPPAHEGPFLKEERNLIDALARHLGEIIEREETKQNLIEKQRRVTLDNRIANVFLTSASDDLYAEVLEVILEELNSRFGYFGYIDEEENLVCPSMTRDIWQDCEVPEKSIVFPKSIWGGLWGQSLMEKKTLTANEGLILPEGHVQLENALIVPIVYKNILIGQFAVANKPGGYSEEDRRLLESAASQTAPILKARLDEAQQIKLREELESQLRHAQKMEAVGTLAGGIAHDFNNILSAVIGYTELCLNDIQKDTLLYQNMSEVLKAGNRAKELVRQILAFSRRDEQQKKHVPIIPLIKETLKMLRSVIPASIGIREKICADQLIVYADATQLNQVLLNLATNAKQAMAEAGGILEVSVEAVGFPNEQETGTPDLAPGNYALIKVKDTGHGIPEQFIDKIFEPYFTTAGKGTSAGTGLGLALAHGIVKSHKGRISVESEPGQGTVFYVHLPLADQLQVEQTSQTSEQVPRGTETILWVDDEPQIVRMEKQRFENLGYQVITKTSGMEALNAISASSGEFDIVITDMTMPDVTGDRLSSEIKKIRPNLPIILYTGFSEKIEQIRELEIDGFLRKPVDKAKMAKMVRNLLDQGSSSN